MKILLINWQDRLNPQAGGAETHLHEVFGRLAAKGHPVTLLASGWPGAPDREELDRLTVLRTGSRLSFAFDAPRFYRGGLADAGFDVVVEALNKVPVFSPRWARQPVVLLAHHLFGATAFREASFPIAAATWLMERPVGRVYRGVPAQAISRSTADDLVARGLRPGDIEVIHPGVDLEFFTPSSDPVRSSAPSFLYLGRLKRYKRVDLVLHASASLLASGIRHRLVIAGTGDHELRLRALARRLGIAETTEFAGYVTESRKRDLFRSAWANIFTSPKEGWGITNVEAAACGTPTIASDAPGLRESVVDGDTGVLVPHGDVDALSRAMMRLAREPDRVERLGGRAREFARGFSWDRAAAATLNHLESVG